MKTSTSFFSICLLGSKPSLALLGLFGVLLTFCSSSPALPPHSLQSLESMSSAELEDLERQLSAHPLPLSHQHEHQLQADQPAPHPHQHHQSSSSLSSDIASSSLEITDCMTISMEEGTFHYKSRGGGDTVCGLYLVADPDKSIVITVDYLDVDCHQRGLISIVDGWELNGELFPSVQDHEKSFKSRFHERCGLLGRLEETFLSSQNAALIQYRIPMFGQGFSVRVQHVSNPKPCNILVQDTQGAFTLQNYGRRVNCSLTAVFDAKIRVLYMSTRQLGSKVKYSGTRTDLHHKCEKLGLEDFVQIGGSSGLETSKMKVIDEFCGHVSNPVDNRWTTVFCGMTTVRLVSSGKYHNRIVVDIQKAEYDDIPMANYICGLETLKRK